MTNNTLYLPFGLPGLNEIIQVARGNKYASAKQKKKYTRIVEAELIAQDCIPDTPYAAISIEFEWIEGARARDPDNARVGAKFILDAMVNQDVIPNDTRKEVRIMRDSYPDGKDRAVIVNWSEVKS